jgi:hypothetical protein
MGTLVQVGLSTLLLLFWLQRASAVAGHDCSEEESRYVLEDKLSRDVSYVRHETASACSIKFRDQSR